MVRWDCAVVHSDLPSGTPDIAVARPDLATGPADADGRAPISLDANLRESQEFLTFWGPFTHFALSGIRRVWDSH